MRRCTRPPQGTATPLTPGARGRPIAPGRGAWLTATAAAAVCVAAPAGAAAQSPTLAPSAAEADFYRMVDMSIPDGIVLEVGGLAPMPGGRLAVSTRRGEVWILHDAYAEGAERPHFTRFAQGLHEPLGLAYRDGALLAAQRGELTRLRDTRGDGRADRFETVATWPLSGNYHEYSFGPELSPDGEMIVTLNLGWIGRGASLARWRGWALAIGDDGDATPIATGMRSPAGFGFNLEGDLFYAENQGDWVGSGFISHVERGDFLGSPEGLRWSGEPGSPLALRLEEVPSTGEPMFRLAERIPALKTPAVWLPHGVMGISTSGILADDTGGRFGPFGGQLFVGDQGHSKVFRVFLERIDGVYQGAVFPFREGFASGVLRLAWGEDGSMVVGMTNRGWSSTGAASYALQRLVWTGRTPFEAERIEARPDGFEITFTHPLEPSATSQLDAFGVTGFTYQYHREYGSPPIERLDHAVRHVAVSEDRMRARLVVDGLRPGYVHELRMPGVRSATGAPLLHDVAYYTLNRVPAGERLVVPVGAEPTPAEAGPQPAAPQEPAAARREAVRGPSPLPAARRQTQMPAAWGGSVDRSVAIGTRPGLRFSVERFEVPAGGRVRLTFTNDDDMLHNLLVVRPGRADAVGEAALALGLDGPRREYVPDGDDVLFHTSLLQPGGAESIYFIAPTEPGEYPFVCTFPGHHLQMRGVMRVVP